MATLSGQTIANRYSSLLKTANEGAVTSTLTAVESGEGTDSDLSIATNKVKVGTALGINVTPSVGKLHIDASTTQAITVDNNNASFILGKGSQYGFCVGDCNPVGTVGGGTSSTTKQANENYIAIDPTQHSNAGRVLIMNGASAGTGSMGIGQDTPATGFIHFGDADKKFKFEGRSTTQSFDVYANSETLVSVDGSNKRVGLGENVTDPASTVEIRETGSAKGVVTMLALTNKTNAADMDGTITSVLFNQWYYDGSSPAVADAARINVGTETDWTSTASTQDSYMVLGTALNGTIYERFRIASTGYVGIGTASPTEVLHVTGNIRATGSITCDGVITPSTRYNLEEYFVLRPGISGDIDAVYTTEAARRLSKTFQIEGANSTSALCSWDGDRAGVLLTTATAATDEMIIIPHEDHGAWRNVKWGAADSVIWECAVTTNATEATAKNTVRYHLGLFTGTAILEEDDTHTTLADQIFFYYDSSDATVTTQVSNGTWHCVYSVNGTDYVTNLGLDLDEGTTYRFRVDIDSSRLASIFINDTQYGLTIISGIGTTGVLINNGAGYSSSGSSVAMTVDTVDATAQIIIGDTITDSSGAPLGVVTAVATTTVTVSSLLRSVSDDDPIHIYGRKAASTTTKSSALYATAHYVPQIGVANRTTAARTLTVHYQKISRNLT